MCLLMREVKAPYEACESRQFGSYRYPPGGLFDGKGGAKAQFLINGEPGNPYGLSQLKPGDVVVMDAPGSGGYGNTLNRDMEFVESGMADGYISLESARNDYGVVINLQTIKADRDATEKLRNSLKK